jgi:hypothetical protein
MTSSVTSSLDLNSLEGEFQDQADEKFTIASPHPVPSGGHVWLALWLTGGWPPAGRFKNFTHYKSALISPFASMGVWQGVAMDSLKYRQGPPCPTLLCLCPVGSHPKGRQPSLITLCRTPLNMSDCQPDRGICLKRKKTWPRIPTSFWR